MDPRGTKPPMPEGMGMPPMMQQMMQKMLAGMQEFNPMAMCQAMMTSVGKAAGIKLVREGKVTIAEIRAA